MQEGDGETNYAYYALLQHDMMPWEFAALDPRKKASLIAMFQVKMKADEKLTKK